MNAAAEKPRLCVPGRRSRAVGAALIAALSQACAAPAPRPGAAEPVSWPWADGQRLRVTLRARGSRNVDALAQRWDMTREQRWRIAADPGGDRMVIAVEAPGEWRGQLAAPDASAGSGYYLGFITGVVIDRGGRVLGVRGAEGARAQARRTVEALKDLERTAGAELDVALDPHVLEQAWSRLLRRLALRSAAAAPDRTFSEPARFAISGARAVPVTYQLTREPAPCDPGAAPDSCVLVDLAGRADPAALRDGYTTTTTRADLESVSRETRSWLLLRGARRDPAELGDRLWGHDRWRAGERSIEARLEDELTARFDPPPPGRPNGS